MAQGSCPRSKIRLSQCDLSSLAQINFPVFKYSAETMIMDLPSAGVFSSKEFGSGSLSTFTSEPRAGEQIGTLFQLLLGALSAERFF